MDTRRRAFLITGLTLVVAITVMPPWGRPITYGRVTFAGFKPIWQPSGVVDNSTLMMEYVIAIGLLGVVYLATENVTGARMRKFVKALAWPSLAGALVVAATGLVTYDQRVRLLADAERASGSYESRVARWDAKVDTLKSAALSPVPEPSKNTSKGRVIGKLGQTLDEAPIRSAATSKSRVYYKTKKSQYIVVNPSKHEGWLAVLLQNGRTGYILADKVARLPYDIHIKKNQDGDYVPDIDESGMIKAQAKRDREVDAIEREKQTDILKHHPLGVPPTRENVGQWFDDNVQRVTPWLLASVLVLVTVSAQIIVARADRSGKANGPDQASVNEEGPGANP